MPRPPGRGTAPARAPVCAPERGIIPCSAGGPSCRMRSPCSQRERPPRPASMAIGRSRQGRSSDFGTGSRGSWLPSGGDALWNLCGGLATPKVRRAALLIGALAALAAIARLDLQPNLARVKVAILSGAEGGNYHAIVTQLANEARSERGHIQNAATQGSVETSSGWLPIARRVAPISRWRRMGSIGQLDSSSWPACRERRACSSSAAMRIGCRPWPISGGGGQPHHHPRGSERALPAAVVVVPGGHGPGDALPLSGAPDE
jgi:hypothetical protein